METERAVPRDVQWVPQESRHKPGAHLLVRVCINQVLLIHLQDILSIGLELV